MDYKLELKPFVRKNGVKCKIIQITDIALHTNRKQATPSVAKKIRKAFKNDKPGRIYAPIENTAITDQGEKREFVLGLIKQDPELVKMIQQEESNGYKVLIAVPKGDIPVFVGEDTVQFMNSRNGKRILRGLAKQKDKDKI